MSVRTPEMDALYQADKEAGRTVALCDLPAIKEWYYFKFVNCKYYHNRICTENHYMIVLKRKCPDWWQGMTNNEIMELFRVIIPELDPKEKGHHFMKLNFEAMRSVSEYPHWHVCEYLPEFA